MVSISIPVPLIIDIFLAGGSAGLLFFLVKKQNEIQPKDPQAFSAFKVAPDEHGNTIATAPSN